MDDCDPLRYIIHYKDFRDCALVNNLINRTKKLITKTIASIPAESVPVFGIAAVVGGTAYEIYVACENLRDIKQLQLELSIEVDSEKGSIKSFCTANF